MDDLVIGSEFEIISLEDVELNNCNVCEGDMATLIDVHISTSRFPFKIRFENGQEEFFSLSEIQTMAGLWDIED